MRGKQACGIEFPRVLSREPVASRAHQVRLSNSVRGTSPCRRWSRSRDCRKPTLISARKISTSTAFRLRSFRRPTERSRSAPPIPMTWRCRARSRYPRRMRRLRNRPDHRRRHKTPAPFAERRRAGQGIRKLFAACRRRPISRLFRPRPRADHRLGSYQSQWPSIRCQRGMDPDRMRFRIPRRHGDLRKSRDPERDGPAQSRSVRSIGFLYVQSRRRQPK